MSCVNNKTARQFNIKGMAKNGNVVSVRLAPGLNVVDDEHWNELVTKEGKIKVKAIETLMNKGFIEFGSKVDDLELIKAPDTKCKSKSTPMPKPPKV